MYVSALERKRLISGVGTYLSGTARAVSLLKVGRLVMHFAVPLFGHRLHIALIIISNFSENSLKLMPPDALICTKFKIFCGFAPDPTGGAYSAPPDPLAGLMGAASWQGRGGGREALAVEPSHFSTGSDATGVSLHGVLQIRALYFAWTHAGSLLHRWSAAMSIMSCSRLHTNQLLFMFIYWYAVDVCMVYTILNGRHPHLIVSWISYGLFGLNNPME